MKNLHALESWEKLEPGEAVQLAVVGRRKVRLRINCMGAMIWYRKLMEPDSDVRLLAQCDGLETICFDAEGPLLILTQDHNVWFKCSEVHVVSSFSSDGKLVFTKVMTRRERNPELEMMMHKVTANAAARINQLEKSLGKRIDELTRASVAASAQGEPESDGGGEPDPEPDAEAEEPAEAS